jgi:hypothetical protein
LYADYPGRCRDFGSDSRRIGFAVHVFLWTTRSPNACTRARWTSSPTGTIRFSPTGHRISAAQDPAIGLWDAVSGRVLVGSARERRSTVRRLYPHDTT